MVIHVNNCCHVVYVTLTPESQIIVCYALQPGVFEIQGCQKSETHRMTSDWP